MVYVFKFEDEKKHAEFLKFYEMLKSNAVPYKNIDKATTRGIGIFDSRVVDHSDGTVFHSDTITYMMNPIKFDLANNVKNLLLEKTEDVDFLLYSNTLEANRAYNMRSRNIREGFLGMGKIIETRKTIDESNAGFYEHKSPKFNIEQIHSDQIIHPLHYRDLEQIMHYLKEDK